ncbi:tyrosine-type recombinase/integrase [Vagococcus fluvialis]|uniref:tyrosine-type recombinase/integrase n=1 Tax=Vagococcus fluvialis TaxID=2738 RepID=UPI001A8E65F1|nr:tyrosine-type recombinase/integrase [Vagococcus fluvialis]MBO0437880.1 tyrosine-type recombinase/integrase [Vagococcus fluvialis]
MLIAILKKYKEFQEEYNDENLHNNVFYHKIYGVPTPENLNKHIKKFCIDNKIEPIITIHGLQHTFASALLYKGLSIFKVSKILGHKNVSVTQSVYKHIIKELDDLKNDKIKELQSELFI